MKILVTGAKGFVVRNLIEELKRQGHEILAYDIDNTKKQLDGPCRTPAAGHIKLFFKLQSKLYISRLAAAFLQRRQIIFCPWPLSCEGRFSKSAYEYADFPASLPAAHPASGTQGLPPS